MSLLMDALKKAEREREALASKESGDEDVSNELSLDPIEELGEEIESAASEADSWDLLDDDEEIAQSFELNLEDTNPAMSRAERPDPAQGRPPPPESLLEGFEDLPLSPAEEHSISLEDTSSTVPSMKAVKASVDRYFDGGTSASMSIPPPPPDDATTVVTRHDTAAQAAAQAVFDAKKKRAGTGAWVWVALVPLFLILAVGIGLYYWMSITGNGEVSVAKLVSMVKGETPTSTIVASSTTTQQSSVTTATQPTDTTSAVQPSATEQLTTTASQTPALTGTETVLAEEVSASSGLEPALSDVLEVEPPPSGDLTPEEALAPEPGIEAEPQGPAPTEEELLAAADQTIREALNASGGAAALQGGGIQFARTNIPSRVNPSVLAGYEAFRRGDYAEAELSYRKALRSDRTNRDAMLGIAAIAVRKNRGEVATQIYRQLLRLNPRDPVASAALLAMQSNTSSPAQESELKLMLERDPNAGHLHFSLGNVYAGQSRWSEAQEAYFNAYRLDNQNADYAYNLAIGLDHLAQRKAAAEYYRRALELAGNSQANFEMAVVNKRLQSLTQASQ